MESHCDVHGAVEDSLIVSTLVLYSGNLVDLR